MIESIAHYDGLVMEHAEYVVCLLIGLTFLSLVLRPLSNWLAGPLAFLALLVDGYVVYWLLQCFGLLKMRSPGVLPEHWGLPLASLIGLAFFALVAILRQFSHSRSAGKG